jgi:cation:H+ antiporter
MAFFILIAGLVLLLFGGELLVKGAIALAVRFEIPTMVIGLTVVSFGTSAPELLVSLQAALNGHPDIAIGNVIGSNVANLALVLGLTSIILPIPVSRATVRIDQPVMILSVALLWFFMWDGNITAIEGAILFTLLILYITLLIRNAKKARFLEADMNEIKDLVKDNMPLWKSIGLILLGCVGLVFGSILLVDGATELARSFGISEYVIGVTIVAFGTSVPELATSLIAAFRKELDISVGNLVGSNIFNIMCILGITSMVKEIPVNPFVLSNDMYWVAGITAAVFLFSYHKMHIHRWKGIILILSYIAYVFVVLQ